MAKFHPELYLLTEHAAGNLPLAQSACISAHMNYCDQCRRAVSRLQDLGAVLFDGLEPSPVSEAQLDAVLARLDDEPPLSYSRASSSASAGRTPAILQRLMNGDFTDLAWKKITKALSISYLKTGDPGYEFALYHIKAGGRIPEHTHRGCEMTLVLEGGFSDADGSYHQGDFLFREASDVHAPTALQYTEDVALGPVQLHGLFFLILRYMRWIHAILSQYQA